MDTLVVLVRTVLTLVIGVLATLVAAPLAIAVASVRPNSGFIEWLIRAWSRAWLAPAGVKVEVEGSQHIDPDTSYVVVSNHLSNLDIMVCFVALPLPIRYLAKKELFRIPLFAQAMRAVGMVEVDREARSAALESINRQSKEVIARGHSLIIYPEGTRSRNGQLRPFKKGAFTMAVASQMPILPVTIEGTYRAWPPGRIALIRGGTVRVVISEPIPTEGLGKEGAEELRQRVREVIEGHFNRLRAAS